MIERLMETKVSSILAFLNDWYTATARLVFAAMIFGYIAMKVFG